MKRCVALAIALFKKPIMVMAPPTTPNMPKSDAPKAFNTRRVVYRDINTVIPILIYRKPVFFNILSDVVIISS